MLGSGGGGTSSSTYVWYEKVPTGAQVIGKKYSTYNGELLIEITTSAELTLLRRSTTINYYSAAGHGGDYSLWQNAAEKSGYASSTLGGLGNIVYSEYKGVERWVGKNSNYYNSSKVRMNGGYARSAQLAKSASMTYKIAGHSMTALSVGFTAVEFAYSDKSGGDFAKLVSAGIGVGLCFIPVIGPGLSIIYGIADSSGAFDRIYDYFDQ